MNTKRVERDNDLIDADEYAAIMGCSKQHVGKHHVEHGPKPVRVGGRGRGDTTLWRRGDVLKYKEELDAKKGEDLAGSGALAKELIAAANTSYLNWKELTVMSLKNDPYRYSTTLGHKKGQWFKDIIDRFAPTGSVHIRGLHYRLIGQGVLLPNGKLYVNADWCYKALDDLSDYGRWLEYVDPDRIEDHRNDAPWFEDFTFSTGVPDPMLFCGDYAPEFTSEPPHIKIDAGIRRQPYRIVLIGEKSSLRPILDPIARQVRGELYLPSGELSNSHISQIEDRAAADGRPLVVLYYSDFDPSGYTMPVTCARKLQARRTIRGHKLEFRVWSVCLTKNQVIEFDLPDSFLKEGEKRKGAWIEAMGREQVEIDALAALQPEALKQIALDAVKPFFDFTLDDRILAAETEYNANANQRLQQHPAYQETVENTELAAQEYNTGVEIMEEVADHGRALISNVLDELPPLVVPEPDITDEPAEPPLFTTDDDFVKATQKLKKHRTFTQEGENESEE